MLISPLNYKSHTFCSARPGGKDGGGDIYALKSSADGFFRYKQKQNKIEFFSAGLVAFIYFITYFFRDAFRRPCPLGRVLPALVHSQKYVIKHFILQGGERGGSALSAETYTR